MPLNLVKLCVGVDEISDLTDWHKRRLAEKEAAGEPMEFYHTTRQTPRRAQEILDGGSLYWVIRGVIQIRQPIIDLRPRTGGDGITRCDIVLAPKTVLTEHAPRRPFQGWRYLEAKDAPRDLADGGGAGVPAALRAELAELGLL